MILEAVFKEEEALKADFGVVNVVNKVDASFVANALKGTASGSAVAMKDVSPLEHNIGVKLASDTITDFSTVTLTKYGKNLLDISKAITEPHNSSMCSFVDNGDGTYTLTKKGQYGHRTNTFPLNIKAGQKATLNLRFIETFTQTEFFVRFVYADGSTEGCEFTYRGNPSIFTAVKEVVSAYLYVGQGVADGSTIVLDKAQIELGTTATEYEPYKEPETVSVKQDGTATIIGNGEGISLMTDTEGVTITAEYNRDLNKAFADIYQKLSALGVAVVNN